MSSFAHDSKNLAETYDRVSDSQLDGGKRLVARMGVKPGMRVLDVGCGTGRLARHLVEVVGATGTVSGVDPLAERIEVARARGGEVTYAVAQAEDLRAFPDQSFDAVVMSAVLHWVEDKPRALAEAFRVLAPGGVLGITTIPNELRQESSMAALMAPVLARAPYAERLDLSPITFAQKGVTSSELVALLLGAHLELVELHVKERKRPHASGAAVLDFLEASSFGNFLRIVPEELRPQLRNELVAALEATRDEIGVVVRDYGLMVVARRAP